MKLKKQLLLALLASASFFAQQVFCGAIYIKNHYPNTEITAFFMIIWYDTAQMKLEKNGYFMIIPPGKTKNFDQANAWLQEFDFLPKNAQIIGKDGTNYSLKTDKIYVDQNKRLDLDIYPPA